MRAATQPTFREYLRQNFKMILGLACFTLIFCLLRLLSDTISYDTDEWLAVPQNTLTHWLSISRYSLVFLKYCFGVKTSLFVLNTATYIQVFIYTVLFLFFLNLGGKSSLPRDFLCGAVLISSPILLEQYYFTLQSAEVSFGMVCMMLSFISTYQMLAPAVSSKMRIFYGAKALFLAVFSFGIYQAFVNLYIIGALIILYKRNDETAKKNLTGILSCLFLFLAALGSYLLISACAIRLFHITPDSYLSILWFKEPLPSILRDLVSMIGRVILGQGNILNLSYTFCLIFIFTLFFKDRFSINWKNFYLLSLLIAPFLLNLLTATTFVVRSLFGFPVVCAFFFQIFYSSSRPLRLALCLTVLSQILHSELLFLGDYVRNQNDLAVAKQIYTDCGADENTVLVFQGARTSLRNSFSFQGQIMGRSFFEWASPASPEDADTTRIFYFMRAYGMRFTPPTPEQTAKKTSISFRAAYPQKGYIVKKENVCYINLGNDLSP